MNPGLTRIKILSNASGHCIVNDADGNLIPGITVLNIQPILPQQPIYAVLAMAVGNLDIEATAILSVDAIKEAAAYWGYKLIPLEEI